MLNVCHCNTDLVLTHQSIFETSETTQIWWCVSLIGVIKCELCVSRLVLRSDKSR